MNKRILFAIFFLLIITGSACQPGENETPATATVTATVSITPTETATATATATATSTPTLTPTPGPLSAEEVFNLVSPSVVYIETAVASGSGLIIDDNYIVTNTHVVWPFEQVRIVFPDGSEFKDVPVLSWDLLGDVAVLGPIETDSEPLQLIDGEDLTIGSEVYLIGYPGEVEEFPKPTITRGLISRFREWEPGKITFFQTDASIGGGQSGGVMVNEYGEVIGISGLSFSDAGFGLVASAADLTDRIAGLLSGEDVSGLDQRRIPTDGGSKSHEYVRFSHEWDSKVYVIYERVGTEVQFDAESEQADLGLSVVDAGGYYVTHADDGYKGRESGSFKADVEAPYFVGLYNYTPYSQVGSISASSYLIPLIDLDDGRGIGPNQTRLGSLDFPGDTDYFNLVLDEGEKINILVDSIMIDPHLIIARPGDDEEQLVFDDDSGGGVFGLSSEMTFIAPDPGSYLLIVQDGYGYNVGGYTVEIREPYSGGPTPMAPKPTPRPKMTEFGPMSDYRSDSNPFTMEYPADWSDDPADINSSGFAEACYEATTCFVTEFGLLAIIEEDLAFIGNPDLDEYLDILLSGILVEGTRVIQNEEFVTSSGLTGRLIVLDFGGLVYARRFVYIHEDQAFNATYIFPNELNEFIEPLSDYTFSTFDVE